MKQRRVWVLEEYDLAGQLALGGDTAHAAFTSSRGAKKYVQDSLFPRCTAEGILPQWEEHPNGVGDGWVATSPDDGKTRFVIRSVVLNPPVVQHEEE